ncbi:hypothetical protein [Phenylobacterium sp.]|jgi:hypothetical protein|uniref:hypothetical protein n=1 Tax=Phenylobacterium sp. TaxID=1871053 RepID=UPI0037844D44
MRMMFCIGALAAVVASPVLANEPARARAANDAARPAVAVSGKPTAKSVYVCDSSAITRRSFAREFGAAEFVSAVEAKAADWSGARCITAAEASRLKRLASR